MMVRHSLACLNCLSWSGKVLRDRNADTVGRSEPGRSKGMGGTDGVRPMVGHTRFFRLPLGSDLVTSTHMSLAKASHSCRVPR